MPSWIDEGSVRVSLKAADGAKGEVVDVQVRRTYLTAASDEEVRKAQDAVQEISDQVNELSDKQKVSTCDRMSHSDRQNINIRHAKS